jgi:hypothetical protein
MALPIDDIASRLELHPSVIENYEEEWKAQQEELLGDEFTGETFVEFMCRAFAESAFLMTAIESNGTAVECLESYDEVYHLTQELLS